VAKVLLVDAPQLAEQLAENVAAQVIAVARAEPGLHPGYTHIVFPATAHGKNVAPRVAALLDVAQVSDISKVIGADTFERPIAAAPVRGQNACIGRGIAAIARSVGSSPIAPTNTNQRRRGICFVGVVVSVPRELIATTCRRKKTSFSRSLGIRTWISMPSAKNCSAASRS
jgi:electron transfer flavoprotein alpha subunit